MKSKIHEYLILNKNGMSKNLIAGLVLLIGVLGFSQSKSINGSVVKESVKVENVAVTLTVDSAEEIESSFKTEDLKEILEASEDNKKLSFKIICNGKEMSSGVKSHASYKLEGNSEGLDLFLKNLQKIRASAIKYYNNKK